MGECFGPFLAQRAELELIDLLRVAQDDDLRRMRLGLWDGRAEAQQHREAAEGKTHR